MTSSFPITPTHGSALRSFKPCREQVTVRICVGIRGRAHRYIIGFNRPSTVNLARNQSVVNTSRDGNWRSQLVERCTPYVSVPGWLRHSLPISRDMLSGFCKIGRLIQHTTAGKCFSFRSRVKFCQEPARGFFHRLEVSKVLSLFALSHAHKKAWRWSHDAQRNSAFRTGE